MSSGPIEPLRVVEIGDLGEVSGKLLGDAGADAIRVEPPAGSATRRIGPFAGDRPDTDTSLRYGYFNTSKRGVTLDPATAEGHSLWWRLVDSADVVIDGAGRGALDGANAGFETCTAREKPGRVVWCSITPFGREGPRADWAANDLVHLALGGPMMSTGYDDHELPPIRPGYEHSLWMAGEYAVCGILAAVLAAEADPSQGPELVDVSIHEAVSCTTEGAFPNWEYRRQLVQRQTGRHSSPNITSPWQHPTADGRYVNIIGGGLPRDLRTLNGLLDWMEQHDAVEDLRDPRYRKAISEPAPGDRAHFGSVVARFISRISAEETYRGAQTLHLPWGVVRRPEENLEDPHWADRGFFDELEVPGHDRPVRVPTAPYRFSETPARVRRRAPLLGEHNTEVYSGELGLDNSSLVELARIGAI
ncbi:MAG: CoA transferase [Myxococcota bacterium]